MQHGISCQISYHFEIPKRQTKVRRRYFWAATAVFSSRFLFFSKRQIELKWFFTQHYSTKNMSLQYEPSRKLLKHDQSRSIKNVRSNETRQRWHRGLSVQDQEPLQLYPNQQAPHGWNQENDSHWWWRRQTLTVTPRRPERRWRADEDQLWHRSQTVAECKLYGDIDFSLEKTSNSARVSHLMSRLNQSLKGFLLYLLSLLSESAEQWNVVALRFSWRSPVRRTDSPERTWQGHRRQ